MANISYGVNLLPKTNNAYTLGNSDYKWSNIYTNQVNGINVADLNAVTDVQINSTSILNNGVANIPLATGSTVGVVKTYESMGLYMSSDGTMSIANATEAQCKAGTHAFKPITPERQHNAVFYGLAKAAGDSTQAASSNTIGTYTANAKTAIQNMLSVAPTASPIFSGSITLGTRYSISQGINDKIGDCSLSIGYNNDAMANSSIAIGAYSFAFEPYSIAIGESVYAWGQSSFAFGNSIVAMYPFSVAIGHYGVSNSISDWATNTSYNVGDIVYSGSYTYRCKTAHTSSGDTFSKGELWEDEWGNAFVVGNGVDYNNLSNALTLHNSGRLSIKGNMYVNANADGSGGTRVPHDIQIDGTSIVSNGVANIPIASDSTFGVIKTREFTDGFKFDSNNNFQLAGPSDAQIKAANTNYRAITPYVQHTSVFYGLAKAAGDTTQASSENVVGIYTTEAKTAIRTMLDVPSINSPVFTGSFSIGRKANTTVGENSVAMGAGNTVEGAYSCAIGAALNANGYCSFCEGTNNTATGYATHAEGLSTTAKGGYSHSEGFVTTANGEMSHSEGNRTVTEGYSSHAEGLSTYALGFNSHAEGQYTIATGSNCHVSGCFNVYDDFSNFPEWTAGTSYAVGDQVKLTKTIGSKSYILGYSCYIANSDQTFTHYNWSQMSPRSYIEIVGNGTDESHRSNARAIDWDGNEKLNGYLYVGCNADSTGGIRIPHDIQINGTSIVSNGIANIPIASDSAFGVVKIADQTYGIAINSTNNDLRIAKASATSIKVGTQEYQPIVPVSQHISVFYGLAKAAGDLTQAASSNAVGIYTTNAKAAIQNMLSVPSTDSPTFTGSFSHNRKANTTVGPVSAVIGYDNGAEGSGAIAMGYNNMAYAQGSIALGNSNTIYGDGAVAIGYKNIAQYQSSFVFGSYNAIDTITEWASNVEYNVGDLVYNYGYVSECLTAHTSESTIDYSKWGMVLKYLFVIGNGNGENARSNALAVNTDGDLRIKGNLYIDCNADSSGGTILAPIEVIRL